ncbi:MAG TPA: glycosyltransferase family A protein, partial [Saprospiraceae bacterium]|nr:glycosyltransferase family A protein [Saprospiraceae bacterium]
MQQVTISAVIPVFNAQQTLRRAVDSLLNQTWLPVEIILVDNNSTDGSPAIMEEYRRRYPDLISIIHQPVPGANAARNAGLDHAGGEW